MKEAERSTARVIFGAQSEGDAKATLPLLYAFLTWRQAALVGLFSGETAADLAIGPRHKIITTGGHQVSVPTLKLARSLAQTEAQGFRKLLNAFAQQRSVSCDIVDTENDVVVGVCTTAKPDDVAIIAQRVRAAQEAPVYLIAREKGAEVSGPSAFADALARHLGTSRITLPEWSPDTSESILARINRSSARAIIIDGGSGTWLRRDLRRLLSAARCPVFIFGATDVTS